MSIASQLAAYIVSVNTNVTVKTTALSIDPLDVGGIGTDLADLLLPFMEVINDYEITTGSGIPSDLDGVDLDQYWRTTGTTLDLYRKINGVWTLKASLPLGFTLPDGPLTLRTSISGVTVTVSAGGWVINNVTYEKLTQTQFTLTAADLNYTRYDLIYADENGDILKLDGAASVSPAYPEIPADCIAVDYAISPASSSGNDPYLLYGGGTSSLVKSSLSFTQANLIDGGEAVGYYLPVTGLNGLYPYAMKVKNGAETLTNFPLSENTAWAVPRYYGFTNNTDVLTITILII